MHKWLTKGLSIVGILVTVSLVLTACSPEQTDSGTSARVRGLEDSNFNAEVQTGVVLVDFWAAWCGPCRVQAPIVDQVAARVEGQAKVFKVDVDAAPKVAQRFNVRSIPTLIVFKNGKPARQFVGVTKADALVSAVTSALDSR
jgi:thioredoxin 1